MTDIEDVEVEAAAAEEHPSTSGFVLDSKQVLLNPAGTSIALPEAPTGLSQSSALDGFMPSDSFAKQSARTIFQSLRRGFRSSFNWENPEEPHELVWEKPTVAEILDLCEGAIDVLEKEPTLLRIDVMPCYILGDIHGNFTDLFNFLEKTGLIYGGEFIPANFLFLGDYVDRGIHDVECVLLLLCLKVLYPEKVFLLRGNHEWSDITNDYDECIRAHLKMYYPGQYIKICRKIMEVFSYLSVSCIVGKKLFCVHGGIPRVFVEHPEVDIVKELSEFPKPIDGGDAPHEPYNLIFDVTWSDPADDSLITIPEIPKGFRVSPRDPEAGPYTACTFEKATLEAFLERYHFDMLIRAHECMSRGCYVQNSCKMITVFSSSGYSGGNSAGVLLLHNGLIRVLRMKDDPLSGHPQSYPMY